jgi:hypothetical protein
MNLDKAGLNLIDSIREALPKLQAKKAEIRERLKSERRCTAQTKSGGRCRAWSVYGDPAMKCGRHGGIKTEKSDACRCAAYKFPPRRRSGFCNFPDEPFGMSRTERGKRRHYKRQKKRGSKLDERTGLERLEKREARGAATESI